MIRFKTKRLTDVAPSSYKSGGTSACARGGLTRPTVRTLTLALTVWTIAPSLTLWRVSTHSRHNNT